MKHAILSIDKVVPNDYNPNEMSARSYEHLKKEVQRIGLIQPLLVRQPDENVEMYELVDGEHRYRIAKELGITEVPVMIAEKTDTVASMKEAMLLTVNLKGIQGEFNQVKYANLLTDLEQQVPKDKLKEFLDINDKELESAANLLKVENVAKTHEQKTAEELTRELIRVYSFKVVGMENINVVNQVLNKTGWDKNRDLGFLVLIQKFAEMDAKIESIKGAN